MADPVRTIRVSDELWKAAAAWAVEEDLTLSQLVRRLLRDHLRSQTTAPPQAIRSDD